MDRNQAKEEVKGRIEEYLRQKGINPYRPFCCLNPAHNDTNPSMSLDRKTNRVHCFSCGVTYDVFDLIGIDYNLAGKNKFDKAYTLFDIQIDGTPRRIRTAEEVTTAMSEQKNPKQEYTHTDVYTHTHTHNEPEAQDYTAYYETCMKRLPETDYTRGLSLETLRRFSFGFDPAWKHPKAEKMKESPRLIIPTSPYSYLARHASAEDFINYRGEKENKSKVGRVHIFNLEALNDSSRPTFIVEGEIDAASICDVGGSALALGSVSYKDLFLRELDRIIKESGKPTQPVIIALDNDHAGSRCAEDLNAALGKRGIISYRWNPCGKYKDANEALMNDRETFTDSVSAAENIERRAEEEERKAYLGTTAGANLQGFINGIAESVNTPCISTGFELLDRVIDGGLYEGLITVGAISSLGKTSLVLQIADQVAAAGNDVLIFSLEMARTELMSKSISRHTLRLALDQNNPHLAKSARGITDGKRHTNYTPAERKIIQDAIAAYSKYADRIFIQEGIGNIGTEQIRETVVKHIRFTGNRPIVILDYIQIVAPYSDKATDKQVVDNCVLELKRMSRDCKLPVIAISSFNRTGYKLEATFEQLKESGAIEYGSDIVIGLQLQGAGSKDFDPTAAKKLDPRKVECVVLKNRQGKVGDKILFNYYPVFNYFEEKSIS